MKNKYDWRLLRSQFKKSSDLIKLIAYIDDLINLLSDIISNNERLYSDYQEELQEVARTNKAISDHNKSIEYEIRSIWEKYYSEQSFYSKLFRVSPPSELLETINSLSASLKTWVPLPQVKTVTRLQDVISHTLWIRYYVIFQHVGRDISPRTISQLKRMVPSLRVELERIQRNEIAKARLAAADNRTRALAKQIKADIRIQLSYLAECPYCGGHIGDSPEADHIYPVASGGLSTPENMVYVCRSCNSMKSSLTLSMFVRKMGFNREQVEARLDRLGKRY
jgi:5-methylcytosine-specific restriction endonuclease McrA